MTLTLATDLAPSGWPEILGRLALAMVLGALCGWDRERKDLPAGLRTYMMVSLGSATIIILGFEIMKALPQNSGPVEYDPARILSGVLTGIGFLGAGTIIKSEGEVRGLTTAAGLWVMACIGLAAGAGMYTVAVSGTACVLVVLVVMKFVERNVRAHGDDGDATSAEANPQSGNDRPRHGPL